MITIPWHNEPAEYVFAALAVVCVVASGLLAASGLGKLMPALIPARAFRRVFGVAVMAALACEAGYLVFYPGGEPANYGMMGLWYGALILLGALLLGGGLAVAGMAAQRGWIVLRRRAR